MVYSTFSKESPLQRSLAVFCASSLGTDNRYAEAARSLITKLAGGSEPWDIVYGGASVGLMGVVADAALAQSRKVVGVLPACLTNKELEHKSITELHLVDSMHQRKALIAERSNAFLALPGGFGTFEEIFEMITWNQLNIHQKKCVFYNFDGFYDGMISQIKRAQSEGFLRNGFEWVSFCSNEHEVLNCLK